MIIVFTKYDFLFNEHYRKKVKTLGKTANRDTIRTEAEKSAEGHLDTLINDFHQRIEYVTVSTLERYPSLSYTPHRHPIRLTRSVFRMFWYAQKLNRDHSEMFAPSRRGLMGPMGCCSANQCPAKGQFFDRVRISNYLRLLDFSLFWMIFAISEGFKGMFCRWFFLYIELTINPEYWIDLGKSIAFEGHILLDCLSRIHLDIIEIWNFHDPEKVSSKFQLPHSSFHHLFKLLSGTYFREEMVKLIEPEPKLGSWV